MNPLIPIWTAIVLIFGIVIIADYKSKLDKPHYPGVPHSEQGFPTH